MRGLFLNVPMTGHINPTLELVRKLVASGDEVIYYCTEEYKAKIESTGAKFRPYSFPISDIDPTKEPSIVGLGVHFLGLSLKMVECHLEEWQALDVDYIITDSCLFSGKIAAKELGVCGMTSTTTFALLPEMFRKDLNLRYLFKLAATEYKLIYKWWQIKTETKRKYGLSPALFDTITCPQQFNINYTSRYFQPMVKRLDPSVHRFLGPLLQLRKDGSEFPFDEIEGKKVIYVSIGTTYNAKPNFFRRSIEAYSNLDDDTVVVISLGKNVSPKDLKIPSKGFIVRESVPQLEILKRAQLFVTHGGMNSINEAMYYGVPVIIYPQQSEQNLVGNRVAELGAGINAKTNEPEPQQLRQLTELILKSPSYRNAANVIGNSFREADGAQGGVNMIHQYARSYSPEHGANANHISQLLRRNYESK